MTIDVNTLLKNVTSTSSIDGVRAEYMIKETNSGNTEVDFTVRGKVFHFWNYYRFLADAPLLDHPARSGRKLAFLVDGKAGAVTGHAIRRILPPEEAIARPNTLGWSGMMHPYKAAGQTFRAQLLTARFLTPEGEEEVHNLLRSALGLDNSYVGVDSFSTR